MDQQFADIVQLIQQSRNNAIRAVNSELINLYWNIGKYLHKELESARWGEKTVDELATFIQTNYPELKGFTRRSLYRMKQFYETYSGASFMIAEENKSQTSDNHINTIVSSARAQLEPKNKFVSSPRTQSDLVDIRNTILAKLSWTHHRTIFSRCKSNEEREFYIKICISDNYTVRDLERQINSALFERVALSGSNFTQTLKSNIGNITNNFKDSHVFEFLNLPEPHNERDLQSGLIRQMKDFILELGKDFLFISQEYKVMVGNSDFYIDLLFYHRGLSCLVAFELKTDKFKPEYLGKLNFYLEALDRDVKKSNENPSMGILLCKDKDSEVVEYAMSRNLSPTMVAEYKTLLPDKKLLQQKLHELFDNTLEA